MPTIEELAVFCKRKGFVYPTSEIYGGMAGFFDYGPLGTELKNNIKFQWWKRHVHQRRDVAGLDGSIIANPKVWEASGHVANFSDLMLTTSKTKTKVRADQFIEEKLKISADGLGAKEINELIKKHGLNLNGEDFNELKDFNLMFQTNIGPDTGHIGYLRPETAQLIFSNFKLIYENARLKLPFGIAQIGKAFRNEISPRDFLFRCREFEQMEIEYFVHPNEVLNCPLIAKYESYKFMVLTEEMQEKKDPSITMTVKEIVDSELMLPWHVYWLAFEHEWLTDLGIKESNLRVRQHIKTEKSHYATDTWDLEYNFPFGWKELEGMANRGDYDLKQHIEKSGKDLTYFDDKEKVIPHVVAEPSMGLDRTFIVFLIDAFENDAERKNVVLHLHPKLAPYKAGVFPLLSNKPELLKLAEKVYEDINSEYPCFYDDKGSIGRRYARMDEIGTPFSITIDFDSLANNDVTIRDRDSMKQDRVKISDLKEIISRKLTA